MNAPHCSLPRGVTAGCSAGPEQGGAPPGRSTADSGTGAPSSRPGAAAQDLGGSLHPFIIIIIVIKKFFFFFFLLFFFMHKQKRSVFVGNKRGVLSFQPRWVQCGRWVYGW